MQNAWRATEDESVPTGTVLASGARLGVESSSIIPARSPKNVTCEMADSLLHRYLPIWLSSSFTSKPVMPAGIDGLPTPSTMGFPRLRGFHGFPSKSVAAQPRSVARAVQALTSPGVAPGTFNRNTSVALYRNSLSPRFTRSSRAMPGSLNHHDTTDDSRVVVWRGAHGLIAVGFLASIAYVWWCALTGRRGPCLRPAI